MIKPTRVNVDTPIELRTEKDFDIEVPPGYYLVIDPPNSEGTGIGPVTKAQLLYFATQMLNNEKFKNAEHIKQALIMGREILNKMIECYE